MKNSNSTAVIAVGTKVIKKSGKPFKSGLKIGTVKTLTINDQDPKLKQAASFEEDESVVSIDKLKLLT